MRCHYTFDEKLQKKILIPGCYGSLHEEDKSCCTCDVHPQTLASFENKEYNERVNGLIEENKILHKKVNELHRIIEKLRHKPKYHENNTRTG